jgi:hypothetical protein
MMMKKVIIITGLLGSILGFFSSDKAMGKEYVLADIYRDLRNKVLTLDPSKIGLSSFGSNRVWGVVMETGYTGAVVTLVTIADGTVSLYFSNGGGIIAKERCAKERCQVSTFDN